MPNEKILRRTPFPPIAPPPPPPINGRRFPAPGCTQTPAGNVEQWDRHITLTRTTVLLTPGWGAQLQSAVCVLGVLWSTTMPPERCGPLCPQNTVDHYAPRTLWTTMAPEHCGRLCPQNTVDHYAPRTLWTTMPPEHCGPQNPQNTVTDKAGNGQQMVVNQPTAGSWLVMAGTSKAILGTQQPCEEKGLTRMCCVSAHRTCVAAPKEGIMWRLPAVSKS